MSEANEMTAKELTDRAIKEERFLFYYHDENINCTASVIYNPSASCNLSMTVIDKTGVCVIINDLETLKRVGNAALRIYRDETNDQQKC